MDWAVDLDPDGRVESCAVTRSSGYRRLDVATCDLIVANVSFAPAVTGDGKRVATTRTGRLVWSLPEAFRANLARAPRPAPLPADELEALRLICKRTLAPGSQVKTRTHCLTRAEWDLALEYSQEQIERWMTVPRRP